MLSDSYPPLLGGTANHVQMLSTELSKRGHEVVIGTLLQQGLPKYEERSGCKIIRMGGFFQKVPFLYKDQKRKIHAPATDWLLTRKLAQLIKQERPDVIHAHGMILSSVFPLVRKFRAPLIGTLHSYDFFCPRATLMKGNSICDHPLTKDCIRCISHTHGPIRSLAAYYGTKINKNKLRSVDRLVAVSLSVKEAYIKYLGLKDEDIIVVPNFYEPDRNERVNKDANLPDDFVLFVGWLMPHKGVDVLIDAYQKLDTPTKLVLVGMKHPDYNYKGPGNIVVIENAPHNIVTQAMSRCRFAIFPSIWPEPFGIVALEAMSCKKAVIASNIGGLKDIVMDGSTGILVPAGDSDSLGQAISYLLENTEKGAEMGQKGYQRWLKNYTPDAVIPTLLDIYQTLIQAKQDLLCK
jgi:glycosyltransferase involved in cell wall biosynthesis